MNAARDQKLSQTVAFQSHAQSVRESDHPAVGRGRSVRAQRGGRSFVRTFVHVNGRVLDVTGLQACKSQRRPLHERYAAMADKKPMIEVTPGNLKWTGAPRARARAPRERERFV